MRPNTFRPRFDDEGNLITLIDGSRKCYIPARHVAQIYAHIASGKDIRTYPAFPVERAHAAFILANWLNWVEGGKNIGDSA